MLTTEQVTQTLEQAITRYEQLNSELADVDGKIRERDALRNQIDWLQAFPGLGEVASTEVADEATQPPQTTTQVVEQTAAGESDAPAAEPEPIEVPDTSEGLRKMKLPELKALAKQEGIEVSGNKSDIVDTLIDGLFDAAQEDEGWPEAGDGPGDAAIPDGFTSTEEAAPAPQAAPEPAPAPQAKPSPFTF